jgi:hypothetical protein
VTGIRSVSMPPSPGSRCDENADGPHEVVRGRILDSEVCTLTRGFLGPRLTRRTNQLMLGR